MQPTASTTKDITTFKAAKSSGAATGQRIRNGAKRVCMEQVTKLVISDVKHFIIRDLHFRTLYRKHITGQVTGKSKPWAVGEYSGIYEKSPRNPWDGLLPCFGFGEDKDMILAA